MKWSLTALGVYCAVASLGCGSSASGKPFAGSYNVMIAANGKSDPDLMTVTLGSDSSVLLTFEAGITTDPAGPNPDGLRATLKSSSMVTLELQPAHIDHSTGELDGNLTGMGTIDGTGTCDITLHFTAVNPPTGAASATDYEITGTKM